MYIKSLKGPDFYIKTLNKLFNVEFYSSITISLVVISLRISLNLKTLLFVNFID